VLSGSLDEFSVDGETLEVDTEDLLDDTAGSGPRAADGRENAADRSGSKADIGIPEQNRLHQESSIDCS
jgi:hypothetical protein